MISKQEAEEIQAAVMAPEILIAAARRSITATQSVLKYAARLHGAKEHKALHAALNRYRHAAENVEQAAGDLKAAHELIELVGQDVGVDGGVAALSGGGNKSDPPPDDPPGGG